MKSGPAALRSVPALALLIAAAPALAQDSTQTTSVFRMFLLPDDFVGLLITWLLVLLSALSVGYTLKLMLSYRRKLVLPDDMRKKVTDLLNGKRYREAIDYAAKQTSYLGRVISAALNEGVHGYGAMERAIEESGDSETTKALRPVEYLNVLGNIAPMIGLFGTVYGMIRAFDQLQASGGKPDPAQLAGGISTAMITTFWGLVVAIPALASYALIRNKIDALTSEGMLIAEQVIAQFKPGNNTNNQPPKPAPQPAAPPTGNPPSSDPDPQSPTPHP
ncbi:MAG: MotA/TolQ/ExbB proton channel family protein [Phycisphaerales bacterium]